VLGGHLHVAGTTGASTGTNPLRNPQFHGGDPRRCTFVRLAEGAESALDEGAGRRTRRTRLGDAKRL
jgi:hypothetical protein